MASQIHKVLKQAIITFTSRPELFASNLNSLSAVLDKTTAEDVNLDTRYMNEDWGENDRAPVTFIDIYEDSNLTMNIFILKSGSQLPLHNHPEMYGLIKVISGKIKITSYSLNTSKTLDIDRMSFKDDFVPPIDHRRRKILTAELISSEVVDVNSKPCILDPFNKNIHEIQSIDGPAAFLDILAPPYNTEIPNKGSRLCSYYAVLSNVMPNVYRLQEIRTPSWYWTDSCPYTGPNLHF
ncbi:2-aminoethanethiol dioxygenase [Leptinotarsa decemlineata]|uniref:2-aminoethanethiol dioxygenase n=1 Tax=Leptinotarsa decemlineata TaxID=7539 RepID=UPI000C2547ED|nr:2-aminoethanethiol dioxygenase [Leptinotarsa decemlineata]